MQPLELFDSAIDRKLRLNTLRVFLLAINAGIFIGVGGALFAMISALNPGSSIYKFVGALAFTLGLNLVVFLKAELFTGNNLMIYSLMTKKLGFKDLLRNWSLAFVGNFLGSLLLVIFLAFMFSQVVFLKIHLIHIAEVKVAYGFYTAMYKAIFCNFLVCSAVWFAITLGTLTKKIIGIIVPITAFVYLGFEHSVANMFFIPLGLFYSSTDLTTGSSLFVANLIPVTIGNIIGAFIFSLNIFLKNKREPRLRSNGAKNT